MSQTRAYHEQQPLTQSLSNHRKTRNDKPEQQWYLKDGATKIQLVDSNLCMDGGAKSQHFPLDWHDKEVMI
jgi:hypothetical protein